MNNREIAEHLDKIARLMSFKGENSFKIKAYEKGARALEEYPLDTAEIIRSGETLNIPGIGRGIGETIKELIENGNSTVMSELSAGIPQSIFDVMSISGIGPRKAEILYREQGIANLDSLEKAGRENRIAPLKGFGEKIQKKILDGIELRKLSLMNRSIGYALPTVRDIISQMLSLVPHLLITETGPLRRRTETVTSLEILCHGENRDEIFKHFDSLPHEGATKIHGNTAVYTIDQGFPVSLVYAEKDRLIPSLVLNTGSEAHISAVSAIMKKHGFTWKGGGLIDRNGNIVELSDETDFYRLLGLGYIPPEIRETGSEISLFKDGGNYPLVTMQDIKGDMQMHSTYSDGSADMEEMAEYARRLGYSYIAITDHSRSLHIARGLEVKRLERQMEEIDRLNSNYAGEFRIFKGSEVDILPDGSLDYSPEILEKLDYLLVSVHSHMTMPKDEMTARIIKAIKHRGVSCLAHPSGRLVGKRKEFEMDWSAIFETALKAGIAIEINSHPSRLDMDEKRARIAEEMGIPVLINTDAHSPVDMNLMEYGVSVARRAMLGPDKILNTRTADEIKSWLEERK